MYKRNKNYKKLYNELTPQKTTFDIITNCQLQYGSRPHIENHTIRRHFINRILVNLQYLATANKRGFKQMLEEI